MAGFRVGLGPNSLTSTRGSRTAGLGSDTIIHAITCRRQGKTSRYFDLADEKKENHIGVRRDASCYSSGEQCWL